jgi:hypothetical protein
VSLTVGDAVLLVLVLILIVTSRCHVQTLDTVDAASSATSARCVQMLEMGRPVPMGSLVSRSAPPKADDQDLGVGQSPLLEQTHGRSVTELALTRHVIEAWARRLKCRGSTVTDLASARHVIAGKPKRATRGIFDTPSSALPVRRTCGVRGVRTRTSSRTTRSHPRRRSGWSKVVAHGWAAERARVEDAQEDVLQHAPALREAGAFAAERENEPA